MKPGEGKEFNKLVSNKRGRKMINLFDDYKLIRNINGKNREKKKE